jgi:hypothetical protein
MDAREQQDWAGRLRDFAADGEALVADAQHGTSTLVRLAGQEARLSLIAGERLLWLMPMLALFAFSAILIGHVVLAWLMWTWSGNAALTLAVVALVHTALFLVLVRRLRQTLRNLVFPRTRAQLERISRHALG